ncbi:MAG TPA: hypothetical protein VHB48_17950, partial [Chitinophagaceae bacterium]|nr:hypothetical protein [Chitinophagaceae bacterium]
MENSQQATGSDEILLSEAITRFRALFRYLFSKWPIIFGIAFSGGVLGITFAWFQTLQYRATLSFSMEDDRSSGGSLAGLAAQFGLDLGSSGSAFSGENIMPLLQSNKITEATLLSKVNIRGKQQSLLNYYCDVFDVYKDLSKSNVKELRDLRFPENQAPSTYSRMQDSMLQLIMGGISKTIVKVKKPDTRINLYTITCTSPDETFSFEYCRQLIKQAGDYYIQTKTQRSAQIVNILQQRSDSLRDAY